MHKRWIFCALLLSAAPSPAQQEPIPKLHFDVVSIKLDPSGEERGLIEIPPGGDSVIVTNAPMFRIVGFAFDFRRNDLVIGAPEWTHTDRWTIQAKIAPADLKAFYALTFNQRKAMLQSVLVERCNLQAHVAKKEVPIYALVIAKNGIRMHEVQPSEPPPRDANGNIVQGWDLTQKHGEIHGRAVPMDALLYALSSASLDRQVIDQTALQSKYNFDLLWTPDDEPAKESTSTGPPPPSIFTALREQLGLKLLPTRAPVDALIIEHIDRPTSN